jgi:LysM repeat protein
VADTAPKAVNDVVASNIAASVATATNLSVAPSVTSLAISTQIESELPSTDDSSISKPQIIQVSSASRKITNYTVAAGDTTDSIAAKFGISKTTLKWANNLSTDNLTVGMNLDILPRDGIAYTVKSGDTPQSIADKYKSDAPTIITFNDLEISGLTPGLKIIVPNGQLPNNLVTWLLLSMPLLRAATMLATVLDLSVTDMPTETVPGTPTSAVQQWV